ncbi:uncharacterized protein LOC116345628 isoform X2 [Contarinia nasturtii]|nr:uncharacterized protein LOC116345628 isoform X2 [Contarinia nasturtii]
MSSMSSMVSSSDDDEYTECEIELMYSPLQLPWNENYWNICVTHVVAPNEVWATLTANANMLSRVERFTSASTLKMAKVIVIDEIYLVKNDDGIHRVRAVKNFWISNRCFCDCFYIDIGKFEAIECNQLYYCTGEYRNVAPQAICFKLFGFDELYNCPHIERCFRAWLLHKQFVGCLMMAEPQYQVQLNHGIKMPKISITLFQFYPKFTLFKPILLKQIGASLPRPSFSTHEITSAKVSHVSRTGIVYFNLDERNIDYVNTLIEQFVNENRHLMHRIHRLRQSEMANCVVLIYDIERNMYHRAKIMDAIEKRNTSIKYKCHCIDTGDIKLVTAANIFVLNDTSILNYYPAQSIGARLHSLPTFEDNVHKRLSDILTHNDVKIQVKSNDQSNTLPTVTIYKDSININKFIHMELELYRDAMNAAYPDSIF